MRYIDADTIADARNAWGCGVPLDKIAGHLRISAAELRAVLQLPSLKATDEAVLWRTHEIDDVI